MTSQLYASEWLNTDKPLELADFHGRVLVVEVFQMLCPGCVNQGLPQAQRIYQTFAQQDVAVIGLHSVFEHHEAMTPVSLRAFLQQFRIRFPVAVDAAGSGPMPRTMVAWELEGTPTLLIFDRQGRLRAQHFGTVSDLGLGAQIMALVTEKEAPFKQCYNIAL